MMYLKWPPLGSVIYLQAAARQVDLRSAPAVPAGKPGQQRSCETTTALHQKSTGPSRSALLSPALSVQHPIGHAASKCGLPSRSPDHLSIADTARLRNRATVDRFGVAAIQRLKCDGLADCPPLLGSRRSRHSRCVYFEYSICSWYPAERNHDIASERLAFRQQASIGRR